MPKQEVTPEEIIQQLDDVLQLFGQAQTPILDTFAALQDTRTKRLKKVDARLAAKLGEDHPRVTALRQARERSLKLGNNLKRDAVRAAKLREIKPYEWVVHGQVMDSQGKPVEGVIVRVFDKDRKFDELLGNTSTDAEGDFQLVYHERSFQERGGGGPELFLQVEDADGQVRYASEDVLRCQGGSSEYFLIELDPADDRKKRDEQRPR